MKRMQQRANSEESRNGSKKYRSRLGEWLRTPPISYPCTHCRRSYPTLQALGGHQNAHRKERREMFMSYMQDKKTQREAPVLSPTPIRAIPPNPNFEHFLVPPPVKVANERDLELGLHYEPNKQVFHEFLPIRHGDGPCAGSKGKEIAYYPNPYDPRYLKLETVVVDSEMAFCGGESSNTNLDLKLKL
ncbi:zinc finger protein 6-like [Quillaja saponaria]|uniref:Zinc finger protein 6-like n=1 Tax=Quillaja saponaria TaxID=32244 RepID=A0AAD7PYB9_QUISA|nr:zinc finger protein 6-like [Quillaja saponaria]